ncbi:MAG: DNA topoisomerase 3 [Magnetococcus sp. DMHC-6]
MILYLCEKPSQARDIASVLGATGKRDGYLEGSGSQVTWCIGHLLELLSPDAYKPEWKTWQLHTLPIIPEHWQLEVRSQVSKQLKIIKGLLKGVHEVVLATDADREGETIGREVLEYCLYRGKISRLWLSALDEASIRKALATLLPGQQTEPLYLAGLGRSRADWLVGMNLSRAYTLLGQRNGYQGVLTVGRVQTPTLKLVVDRDRLIENFKPVAYFDVLVQLQVEKGQFQAKWIPPKAHTDEEGRCLNKELADQVVTKVQGQTGVIQSAETKRKQESPPLPLELSTLQQEASRRWGMGAQRLLEVAQALYEKHKAITYPRTDCRYLPCSQRNDVPTIFAALTQSDPSLIPLIQAADSSLISKAWNDTKITAHHAIIPTGSKVHLENMSHEEKQVYDLIRRHYLAQFFPAFEYDQTILQALIQQELFRASGRVEKIAGWKQVLRQEDKKSAEQEDTHPLPQVQIGQPVQVVDAQMHEKQTKPPERYTEGTLIQAMKNIGLQVEDPRLRKILRETAGIGTEATRASIIENLLKRGLLVKEGKKSLLSQPAGRALVDMLPHSVTDPATTAVWEQALDDIAHSPNSQEGLQEFLNKSIFWVQRLIHNVKEKERLGMPIFAGVPNHFMDQPSSQPAAKAMPRPRRRPPNKQAASANDPSLSQSSPEDLLPCPKCHTGQLIKRIAKRGHHSGNHFLGCNQYPQCRHIQPC